MKRNFIQKRASWRLYDPQEQVLSGSSRQAGPAWYALIPLLSLALLLGGCRDGTGGPDSSPTPAATATATPTDHDEHAHHDHQHEEMGHDQPTDLSLYNLDSAWENQEGAEVSLTDLQGQPVLLAMVYASCKAACPRIIADMKTIEKGVSAEHPEKMRLVLVSIDPEVDTPARLKQLAKEAELGDSWQLLRSPEEQVLELAALLGVKYRKVSETDYAHSNLITVLNQKGEVIHQQVGLGVDPAKTLEALAGLK